MKNLLSCILASLIISLFGVQGELGKLRQLMQVTGGCCKCGLENVKTCLSKDNYTVTQGDVLFVENDDIFIPALWLKTPSIIACSKEGYKDKSWKLPKEWLKVNRVKLSRITMEGKTGSEIKKIRSGKLTISLGKDEMVLIEKES